jgi:hypothetical protein
MTKDRHAKSENRKYIAPETTRQMLANARLGTHGSVTAEELKGAVATKQGLPVSAIRGVPAPYPSFGDMEPQTPHCTAITKKGAPCKAAPIRGEYLCIGHSRSIDA